LSKISGNSRTKWSDLTVHEPQIPITAFMVKRTVASAPASLLFQETKAKTHPAIVTGVRRGCAGTTLLLLDGIGVLGPGIWYASGQDRGE